MTAAPLPAVDVVAIGASAGGIDALFTLLQDVDVGSRAALIAVLHLPADGESRLTTIFTPRVRCPVVEAQSHAPLAAGTLHFAPPDYHLLVEPDLSLSLSCEPPVNYSRPSIDVLFESCAALGARAAGVLLTGANDDGARGLLAMRRAGALTAVQDPAEAAYAAMPRAAVRMGAAAQVLPLAGLRMLLQGLLNP